MRITKQLVIMGAGGFGREVHAWLLDSINKGDCKATSDTVLEIAGYITDVYHAPDAYPNLPPILSRIDDYVPEPNTYVVCGIADPAAKKLLTDRLLAKGAEFFTLIHPTVVIGTNVVIGKGTVICPLTVLSTDLVVGDFVTINSSCTVGHDSRTGNYCTLSGHCDVTGGVTLLEGAFLGSHAVIVPKVVVGEYAVIGAGSVVIRKDAPGVTVFGVPAKRISG